MNVGCPQCSSIFRVDPAKVPPGGVRARCSICGGVIPVPEPTAELIAAGPQPPVAPMVPRTTGQYSQRRTPAMGVAAMTPPAGTRSAAAAAGTPAAGVPAFPVPAADGPRAPTPPYQAAAFKEPAPPAMVPAPAGVPGPTASINPYLARDPDVRAKRLARALISDIVTYYPEKHADALRAGSLKQTFSEEIKKSYEEYVAQIGQAFAESTTHFKDALNEVLGEGKKIF
ncbi:MAG TPA: zinc-ribbon domain-containing protein [Gemmatimonadaceae bacterium]|nr:zinc-ribbon domain-containing protein [Gemmatimonadaceae bacterium]